jgi:hypothetical protein
VLVVCLGALLVPTAARAQLDEESTSNLAHAACLSGDIKQGISLLAQLYVQTKDAAYIYNQARCFEQNDQRDQAVSRYREFLRVAIDADPEVLARARAAIDDLKKQQNAEPRTDVSPPARPIEPPHAIVPRALPPQGIDAPPVMHKSRSDTSVEQSHGDSDGTFAWNGYRLGALAAGGIGLAGMATGVYMGMQVNSITAGLEQDERDSALPDAKPLYFDSDVHKDATNAEFFQYVGYAVGGVGIASAAVLWFLGSGANDDPNAEAQTVSMGIHPTATPSSLGVGFYGRY